MNPIGSAALLLLALPAADDDAWKAFRQPPAQARPFVRWWWNGDCVDAGEIVREIEVMHRAGIGGFEINPIAMPPGSDHVPEEGLEWLSAEWCRNVRIAADAARERGMIADLIVGSGWPFGAEFLSPDEMTQRLVPRRVALEGPALYRASRAELLAVPRHGRAWEGAPRPVLQFLKLGPERPRAPGQLVDLRARLDRKGDLELEVPPGRHLLHIGVLIKGYSSVVHGAPGARGPVLDHYNERAVRAFLERMSTRLAPALGGRMGNCIRAVFCDSIELSGANWTGDLPREFHRRRGYELAPWLPFVLDFEHPPAVAPALADEVRRARHDFCRTLVELFHERFIETYHGWCRENGCLSRFQAYGHPWLMGMADGYRIPDIPETNNWLFSEPDTHGFLVWTKYASSAGHLSGRRIVSSEAMTNTRGVFQATLGQIKAEDDFNFIMGVNHSVLHGFNYSPPAAGFPGWIRYGAYFSERNSWWPYFRRWADSNARLSAAFQAARPRVQAAILAPTADLWSEHGLQRGPFHQRPWYVNQLWKALSCNGVCADYVSEAVVQRAVAEEGALRYGPQTMRLLICCDTTSMQAETAAALSRLARGGVKLVFVGAPPARAPGRHRAKVRDRAVRDALAPLEEMRHPGVLRRSAPQEGCDLTAWAGELIAASALACPVRLVPADARLYQVQARDGQRDLVFLANRSPSQTLRTRAVLARDGRAAWAWDPHTGSRRRLAAAGDAPLDLELPPHESLLVVLEPDPVQGPESLAPPARTVHKILSGPWNASFRPVQGEPFTRTDLLLEDLGRSTDPALARFGGAVDYRVAFSLAKALPPGSALDLGAVYDISEVAIDGRPLGVRWYGRHLHALPAGLPAGAHELEIRVTTVLFNTTRALGDNATAKRWFGSARSKDPVPAGLVGPVRLLTPR